MIRIIVVILLIFITTSVTAGDKWKSSAVQFEEFDNNTCKTISENALLALRSHYGSRNKPRTKKWQSPRMRASIHMEEAKLMAQMYIAFCK